MRRWLNRLLDTSRYTSPVERELALSIYCIVIVAFAFYSLYLVFGLLQHNESSPLYAALSNPFEALALMAFYGAAVAGPLLLRSGQLGYARYAPIVMWLFSGVYLAFSSSLRDPQDGGSLLILIILAAFLLGERGLLLMTILAGSTVILVAARSVGIENAAVNLETAIVLTLQLIGVAAVLYLFRRLMRAYREGVADLQEQRVKLAEVTSQVAQRISSRLGLDDVLTSAVEQTLSGYPEIYHAQIFLLDGEGRTARLAASTGEVGKLLLARQHSLPVGSQSVIGRVTATGVSVVARVGESAGTIHRRNEYLPDTAAEAAFPLRIGDQVIGALDLQSRSSGAFHQEELPIFQSLADHLAIAIDNARLFDETNRRLEENQQLVQQAREAAHEVERLNRRLIAQAWQDFVTTGLKAPGISIDFERDEIVPESEWTPALEQSTRTGHLVQEARDGALFVSVPLRVRGQVIGAMEFELGSETALTPEDLNLLEEVGDQFGLAAETSRLFETSQRMARREAIVNEIAGRLEASNSIEMTLNAAARSLRDVLKANRVAIQLGGVAPNGGGAAKR